MHKTAILFFFLITNLRADSPDQHAQDAWCNHARSTRKIKREWAPRITELVTKDTPTPNTFVTKTELSELLIPELIDVIDYTQTAFGRAMLENSDQLLTANVAILQERQAIAQTLYADPDLHATLTKNLHSIGKHQESILAYISADNPLNKAVEALYFDGSALGWINKNAEKLIKKGNTHPHALTLGTLAAIVQRCDSFFIALFRNSITDSLLRISLGITTSINLDAFLFDGIKNIISAHTPWFRDFDPQNYRGDHQDYCRLMEKGTFADKMGAYLTGSKGGDNSIGFSYIPVLKNVKYTWRKASDFIPWDQVPWYKKAGIAASLIGTTAYQDYRLLEDGKNSTQRIKAIFRHLTLLRGRLIAVKEILKNIAHLCQTIAETQQLHQSRLSQAWRGVEAAQCSAAFTELITLLKTDTFSGEQSIFFIYGNVLRAHLLLQQCADELRSIFSAVGELDTYCSVAMLMHQHDTQRCSFSFVSFIPSATPVINLTDCWTPLIKPEHAVSNTFTLGSNGTAIKGIITGPNGGGKSTILKSLGHALYLAHTFGIASAQESLISPFTSLRTCFHPQENLSEELSQFMAEKKCMDAVAQHVYDSRSTGFTCLLIDEPYRGTVNTETGERIYSFGSSVAPESHAVLLVATHVEKPIQLANDTQGLFDNYQVLIQERSPTTFKRTFKIAPGVAHWWFESADRRSRFIDWLCHDKNV